MTTPSELPVTPKLVVGRTVYAVLGWSGTSPSDSTDWLEAIYESKEDADAFAEAHNRPSADMGYEVKAFEIISRRISSSGGNKE